MAEIKTVALAGALGALGAPVLQALLDAGFTVTALTRPNSQHTFPSSVKVAEVAYDDVENLTSALKGHDALISTLSTTAIGQQEKMVDAAIAAGVKRFIPSEFGCDISNPKARQLPVFGQKVQIEDELEKKCSGTETTYTFVYNNVFFDWGIDNKFLINIKEKKMDVYDGGESVFTTTPLAFIAKGVVGILRHPEETKNKGVRLHGAGMTQKKMLDIAQSVVGKDEWEVTDVKTGDLERNSYENLEKDPGNVPGWIIGFLKTAIFADGYGGDFSKNNDNEMLGLKELSKEEVEDTIRSRA